MQSVNPLCLLVFSWVILRVVSYQENYMHYEPWMKSKNSENSIYNLHRRWQPTWHRKDENGYGGVDTYDDYMGYNQNRINYSRWKDRMNHLKKEKSSIMFQPLKKNIAAISSLENDGQLKSDVEELKSLSYSRIAPESSANEYPDAGQTAKRNKKRRTKNKKKFKKKRNRKKNNRKTKKNRPKKNKKNKPKKNNGKKKKKSSKNRKGKSLKAGQKERSNSCQYKNLVQCSKELDEKWGSLHPCSRRQKFFDCMTRMRSMLCTHDDGGDSIDIHDVRKNIIKKISAKESCILLRGQRVEAQ